MRAHELQYNEIYYLVLGDGSKHLQGRFHNWRQVSRERTPKTEISFITHNGSMTHTGYMVAYYVFRPATRKEKFLLWFKGELPKSIYTDAMIKERGE
jgi:hypothetical protein